MSATAFDFIGGPEGPWRVTSLKTLTGDALPLVAGLQRRPAQRLDAAAAPPDTWALKGVISNVRYAEKAETVVLAGAQVPLGRPEAGCAALIQLRKSAAWWALAQDERWDIFEQQSHQTRTGLRYLPAIARQFYHCRDLGQPFDFLTWFEFAPAHAAAFNDLLSELRKTPEWAFVDREIDIRLMRT